MIGRREGDDWGDDEDTFRFMLSMSPSYTILKDDTPIVVLGAWKLWDGAYEVFARTDDKARQHSVAVVRIARGLLASFAQANGVHRYSSCIRADKPEYIRWIKLLGFEFEYTMEGAIDGEVDILGFVRKFNGKVKIKEA